MYSGKNPTAINSQRMLLAALNELLAEKKYKDVSVSEICARSGISRQTFYTLFGTKENLIRYQLEQSALSYDAENGKPEEINLAQTCKSYSEFVASNYEQFKMLVENDLMEVLGSFISRSMSSCEQSFVNVDEEEREYAALFMSAGLCQLTRKYIREHEKPDRQELARLALKIMSGEVYPK